nr:BMS1-like protein [Cryptomonas curvata]
MIEKLENPIIISVVGPRRVGKTTFINSLTSYYSSYQKYFEDGIVLIFTKEKTSYLFIESPSDNLSMINLAKASDIIILVIDCYFGLELETFEFLSLSTAYGCPRILCILTHLDLFKDWKSLRKAKKRIKKRLKFELGIYSKIFFFSGINLNEKYLTREISNFTRYLSSIFLYPSALQKNSSYIVVSAVRINVINNNQKTLLFGFSKGKKYKYLSNISYYIPGIGNVKMINFDAPKFEKKGELTSEKYNLYNFRIIFFSLGNNKKILNKVNFLFLNKKIKKYQCFYFLFYLLCAKKKTSGIHKFNFKYIESSKFFFNYKITDCSTIESLLKKKYNYNSQIESEKFFNNHINQKQTITKKKTIRNKSNNKYFINTFTILESSSFPSEFRTYFNPSYPIIIQLKYSNKNKIFITKAKITKHKWNKTLLHSKYSYIVSIGWKIFKTILIFFREDCLNRKRYQKYLCADSYLVCFYSTFVEIDATIVGIKEENLKIRTRTQGANFNILFIGNILPNNDTLKIVKKTKLKGIIYNSFRKTAFVKNMFSNEIEISRFIGSLVQTISGIRGIVKKPVNNGPIGSFRATFEKNIILGEIVFLRMWFPIQIPRKLEIKNFFDMPNDLREMDNENFLNSSDYLKSLKKEVDLKILKNFEV